MRKKHTCLLALQVWEFTGNDIGKLRDQYLNDRYLDKILPQYTLNTNKNDGTIIESDGFYQFVNSGEQKNILFDYLTVDELLKEEISNCGLEYLLKGIDLRPYLDKFTKHTFDDFKRSLNSSEYLVIDIEYISGGYWNEYESETFFEVKGVLTQNNLNTIL